MAEDRHTYQVSVPFTEQEEADFKKHCDDRAQSYGPWLRLLALEAMARVRETMVKP